MPANELPTGTVTFLFTDIEGSTRLLHALGEGYRSVLERHFEILRSGLAAHGGVEVNNQGDGAFAVFKSAQDAVASVVQIQRAIAAEAWPPDGTVRIRMGLHTGEGTPRVGDYMGLDVHRAARISAAGHGGQVLLSAPTRDLVAPSLTPDVGLRSLGTHRLKDLELPEELSQLTIDGLEQEFPAIRTLEIPSDLPADLTSFIGREHEVEEVARLLAGARLITLTGPGGTGKTRLALRVAARVGPTFHDGPAFVDLAPLTDPSLVGPTIARTLGLSEQGERPIEERLKDYLENREVLLVMDNFEHLLAGSGVVSELLTAAARLRVLVTSRIVLGQYGEQEYPVPPLRLPEQADATDPAAVATNEAVALFVERARASRPSFELTPERTEAVVAICRRLDGLPLAIELAASRIRMLEPADILSRLEQHLPVLTGPANLPERHRTLRGAIEWSYELLRPAEQVLFVRLSIFAGGFDIDAATKVGDPDGELGTDPFDLVASLVSQSLLRLLHDEGATRFGMLETIREYARERLEADPSLGVVHRRHLGYFCELAETAEPHLTAADQGVWLDRLERELDNIREALGRAFHMREAAEGLRLASALWRFWFQRGYLREGRSWLEALLASESDVDPRIRAKAYTALGALTYWLVDVDATAHAYETAVRLYHQIGDREAEAQALHDLGYVPALRNDVPGARAAFQRALEAAMEVGRPDLIARTQHTLGFVTTVGGDPVAGLEMLHQALETFRQTGDRDQEVWTISEIGQAHRLLGQFPEARARYLEALRLNAEAQSLPGISTQLQVLGDLASGAGRHEEAVRLRGAALKLRETTGAIAPAIFSMPTDVEGAARAAIGDAAVDEALAAGQRMTLDEMLDYAFSLKD